MKGRQATAMCAADLHKDVSIVTIKTGQLSIHHLFGRLQVSDTGNVKGRQATAMHAATVYMACRLEHNPRTFKEILAGAPGTSKVRSATASRVWGSRFRHEVHRASSDSADAHSCASRATLVPCTFKVLELELASSQAEGAGACS